MTAWTSSAGTLFLLTKGDGDPGSSIDRKGDRDTCPTSGGIVPRPPGAWPASQMPEELGGSEEAVHRARCHCGSPLLHPIGLNAGGGCPARKWGGEGEVMVGDRVLGRRVSGLRRRRGERERSSMAIG